jgi:hypothetical protein
MKREEKPTTPRKMASFLHKVKSTAPSSPATANAYDETLEEPLEDAA